ncbi:MAG: hypothetical protein EDQ89_08135 [Acidobacteria bacterium]|nr:MAG: hypothetical protein EDQ89_08135 [Acidobacteriota bacterium]MCL4286437.1 hypothetical protein [Thermoleophilia bacterium]GIK77232.1 MAG: hypothetical protein BroJett022_09220 [Actinomycetes bacterium]
MAFGDAAGEQTREERLEIARRYRERRGAELRALAATRVEGEILAAGEFSTVPTEAIASVPLLGMALLPLARRRRRRDGLGLAPAILLALTASEVHALALERAGIRRDEAAVTPARAWPRSGVRAERAGRAFMRDVVLLHLPERSGPLKLYAPTLRTNPWSAEVVRLLGGDAPEPLDLGSDKDREAHPDSGIP